MCRWSMLAFGIIPEVVKQNVLGNHQEQECTKVIYLHLYQIDQVLAKQL